MIVPQSASDEKVSSQAAAPAGGRSSNGDSANQSNSINHGAGVNVQGRAGSNLSEAATAAFYDLAYCYLLNGEHLRCVELLENNELVYSSLKFRILVGQALFKAGSVQACIRVLEKDPRVAEDDSAAQNEAGALSEPNHPILTPD